MNSAVGAGIERWWCARGGVQGLVGLCYDMTIPIQLNDARRDSRHLRKFDEKFDFETRAVLCVPVVDEHGVHGVIELLNPRRPFSDSDVDAARQIANTLAGAISGGG